jgi:nucleoside-diphosphate-sugar epimerase
LTSVSTEQLAAIRADVCVHSAWITTPGVYLESPENFKFRDDSLQFLQRVAEAGAKHIVGLGTCIEYQITGQPLSEDRTPIAPATTYAKCKNELRVAMEAEAKKSGFSFAWGRVFYPYGPGEHPSRLCSSIIAKLGRGEKMVLKTPQSTKDYIYIDDLAAALLAVVENKFSGAINLGTGAGTTVRDIAHTIGRLMGRKELVGEASPPEPDPLGDVIADATKLKSLGWEQKTNLTQGIQALLAVRK